MGIVLEETNDSFIVGLPARLIKRNGTLEADPYVPTPNIRFFKSTLLSCIDLVGEFELPYLNYVLDNNETISLTKEDVEQLKVRIGEVAQKEDSDILELPERIDFIFPESESVH